MQNTHLDFNESLECGVYFTTSLTLRHIDSMNTTTVRHGMFTADQGKWKRRCCQIADSLLVEVSLYLCLKHTPRRLLRQTQQEIATLPTELA